MKGRMECNSEKCKGKETVQEWIEMTSARKDGMIFTFRCTRCNEITDYHPDSDIYGAGPWFKITWIGD